MQTAPFVVETPLISPVPPAGEEDRVNQVFTAVNEHLGFIPDGLRLYGISPPLLESFAGNINYFRSGTKLSPVLTTLIRYLVSWQSSCRFCIDMNESFLLQMGLELEAIRAACENPDRAPIDTAERPLLKLALKAINEPQAVNASDLDAARSHGWTDRDIFDAVAQAASNRAFNLVLRTFKVEGQGVFA